MKKRIIVTSGPTNEQIDAVMKITNMSTGALGSIIAETFLRERREKIEKIYFLSPKLSLKPRITSTCWNASRLNPRKICWMS